MPTEIEIILHKKKKATHSGRKHPPRGPIHARRHKDEGRRRVRSNLIRFYDLGEIKVGSQWMTLPFRYSMPASITGAADHQSLIVDDLPDTLWRDDLTSMLLAITDRKNTTRQLTQARIGKYGVSVSINDGEFTPLTSGNFSGDGLAPGVDTLTSLGISSNGIAIGFDTAAYRVTKLPSPDASEVAFNIPLKGGVSVYLAPRTTTLYLTKANNNDEGYTQTEGVFLHAVQPRSLLDLNDPGPDDQHSAFSSNSANEVHNTTDVTAYATYIEAVPDARYYFYDVHGGFSVPDPYTHITVTATPVAIPPDSAGSSVLGPGYYVIAAPYYLAAIIEQGANTYYLWGTGGWGFEMLTSTLFYPS